MVIGPTTLVIGGLLIVGIGLLVLLVGAARRGTAQPVGNKPLALFTITRWGALIYAALMAVVGIVSIITTLSGDVTIDVPVAQFWPTIDPRITVDPADATIVSGGFTTASLTIAGLDLPTRLLLVLQTVLWGGMTITISLAIARIAAAGASGHPFTSVLPRATTAAAVAVGIGGFGAQVVGGIASSMASHQALSFGGWSAYGVGETETVELGLPQPTLFVQFDLWPVLLFVALSALAAIFTHAERLQRSNEKLERDTAGLV